MRVIGLTGGIASGKSTVSAMLAKHGLPILDCDRISRELMEPGQRVWQAVKASFGDAILQEDGSIDRKALAATVFSDKDQLELLNAISHPAIVQTVEERLRALRQAGCTAAVVDAPLLIEAGLDRSVDEIWVVIADRETKIARAMLRDGSTREAAAARLDSQLSDEEKCARGDCIIENNGTLEELEALLERLLQERGLTV